MSDTPNYVEWRPEYDGHAPPYWREGMNVLEFRPTYSDEWRDLSIQPSWGKFYEYRVPPEALTASNEVAGGGFVGFHTSAGTADNVAVEVVHQHIDDLDVDYRLTGRKADEPLPFALSILRAASPDELAKHGITLAEPKDWATELSEELRELYLYDQRNEAITLIRERVVLKGEG